MFFINLLKKIIKALGSNSTPNQLAAGFALGMILGLTPFWNIHNLVIIFIIGLVNVNISTALLGGAVFGIIAPLFDPFFHTIGLKVLQWNALDGLFTGMYNSNFWILTRFNNTIVIGSLVLSLVIFVPVYFGFKAFSKYYQETLHPKVEKWKITKLLKGSKIFKLVSTGNKFRR